VVLPVDETDHVQELVDALPSLLPRLAAKKLGELHVFRLSLPYARMPRQGPRPRNGEIVPSFRRAYDRVKYAESGKLPEGYPKYYDDLCRLVWHKDTPWAVTSTFDKTKGILVDVFSREGRFLDNFYFPLLKIRRNNFQDYAPMAVARDFLYVLEANEDDILSLIRYEIVGESS
jgi:hypothetical protein